MIIHGVINMISSMAGRVWTFPALVLCLMVLTSSAQQRWDPGKAPERRDFGYHCEDDPRCICFGNYIYSRHCEGSVHVYRGEQSGFSTFTLECDEGKSRAADPYVHLSNVRALRHNSRGAKLTVRGCPPPRQGFSALIQVEGGDQTTGGEFIPILTLTIYCPGTDTFHLSDHHFAGLRHLHTIELYCPSQSSFSATLLSGISRNVTHFSLINSPIEALPDGFFSGLTRLEDITVIEGKLGRFQGSLIRGLSFLIVLNLKDNRIEHLDDDMFQFSEQLSSLQINSNKISELPSSLCGLRNLASLDASENQIVSLPQDCLFRLTSLHTLVLSRNRIVSLYSSPILINGITPSYSTNEVIPPGRHTRQTSSKAVLRLSPGAYNGREYQETFTTSTVNVERPGIDATGEHPQQVYPNSSTAVEGSFRGMAGPDILPFLLGSSIAAQGSIIEGSGRHRREITANSKATDEPPAAVGDRVFSSKYIGKLHLSDNFLSSLPDKMFYGLSNLTVVHLSRNKITRVHPDAFVQNLNLEDLFVSDNLLTEVPDNLLRQNSELSSLVFSRNSIRTLGSSFFSNNKKLRWIDFSNNRLDHLPADIFKPFDVPIGPGGFSYWIALHLNLAGNLLESIPTLTLPRLAVLNLSRNRLTNVSANMLEAVPYLERLDLSHNLIESLGGEPGSNGSDTIFGVRLSRLAYVDLSGNRLSTFPWVEPLLGHLKALNLSWNQIPCFPSGYGKNFGSGQEVDSALDTLDLSGNTGFVWPWRHQMYDWEISLMLGLKHLNLSSTGLIMSYCMEKMEPRRKVWGCLSHMTELESAEVLILSHNEIEYMPMEFLHYLPKLRLVDLSHNKIKRLWHHDFLVTNGVTDNELERFDLHVDRFVHREGGASGPYYEFPNTHHLTIDLRNNLIESVILPEEKMMEVPQNCDVERQFARASLLLAGNPLVCGCSVFRLLQFSLKEVRPACDKELQEGHRLVLPATVDIQGLQCAKPDSVKGKAVSEPETWAHHLLPLLALCQHQQAAPQKLLTTAAPVTTRRQPSTTVSSTAPP